MSVDFDDIAILTMLKQDILTAVDAESLIQAGSSLDSSLLLANRDNSSDASDEFLETAEVPADSLLLEPDMPGDAGGHIDIYEPTIYIPEGFGADDLYQTEFILDSSTGVITIILYFSQDPLDHSVSNYDPFLSGSVTALGSGLLQSDFDDLIAPDNQSSAPPKCTVTITRTTTQNSGSSTVSFLGGLVKYETRSESSSTTTTTSVTYESTMVNGRCVLRSGR